MTGEITLRGLNFANWRIKRKIISSAQSWNKESINSY